MLVEQRRQELVQAIESENGLPTVTLAERFGVSEMTIRRDLQELASRGLVQRVRGGAMQLGGVRDEPPFDQSTGERSEEKVRIGRAAAELVKPGHTVIIDIGTTALQVARHLHGRPGLTVVTNNLAVYEELAADEAVDLLLLGGLVRRNYRSVGGLLTQEALGRIRADLAFIGISGIDHDLTLLDTTIEEIPVKRAIIAASNQVVLLADGAKFWGSGLSRVANIDVISTLITTEDAPAGRLGELRERGIEVRTA